jgi:F-type H+-transporting ATPase subunit epsilon
VVSWQGATGNRHFCAVRRGVLTVTAACLNKDQEIAIATREAVPGDDLATLEQTILAKFRTDSEAERSEHVASTQLQLNAIRQLVGRLHATSVNFA